MRCHGLFHRWRGVSGSLLRNFSCLICVCNFFNILIAIWLRNCCSGCFSWLLHLDVSHGEEYQFGHATRGVPIAFGVHSSLSSMCVTLKSLVCLLANHAWYRMQLVSILGLRQYIERFVFVIYSRTTL